MLAQATLASQMGWSCFLCGVRLYLLVVKIIHHHNFSLFILTYLSLPTAFLRTTGKKRLTPNFQCFKRGWLGPLPSRIKYSDIQSMVIFLLLSQVRKCLSNNSMLLLWNHNYTKCSMQHLWKSEDLFFCMGSSCSRTQSFCWKLSATSFKSSYAHWSHSRADKAELSLL